LSLELLVSGIQTELVDAISLNHMTTFLIGLLIGFIAGLLVIRNNAAKAAKLEDKGKTILDILKGR